MLKNQGRSARRRSQHLPHSRFFQVIADSPGGPRGDAQLSEQLKSDISNLMLLCDVHHRLVDKIDVPGHPANRLQAMKTAHERRIEIVSAIQENKQSHVLLYGANVGEHSSPVSYRAAAAAMLPDWYPADSMPLSLGMVNSSLRDATPEFWAVEKTHLQAKFAEIVRARLDQHTVQHLSVFALAPQPLLILLGTLLCDIVPAEVYQPHREPPTWRWQTEPASSDYIVTEPEDVRGQPALVLAISATVVDERITSIIGPDVAIWRVTVQLPNNDVLKSKGQAERFRQVMRPLLDRLKARHGERATIHVFPAMPAALAVEFGRVIMPKADLPMVIYDQSAKRGGFIRALETGEARPTEAG